jgi:hypothetical protein
LGLEEDSGHRGSRTERHNRAATRRSTTTRSSDNGTAISVYASSLPVIVDDEHDEHDEHDEDTQSSVTAGDSTSLHLHAQLRRERALNRQLRTGLLIEPMPPLSLDEDTPNDEQDPDDDVVEAHNTNTDDSESSTSAEDAREGAAEVDSGTGSTVSSTHTSPRTRAVAERMAELEDLEAEAELLHTVDASAEFSDEDDIGDDNREADENDDDDDAREMREIVMRVAESVLPPGDWQGPSQHRSNAENTSNSRRRPLFERHASDIAPESVDLARAWNASIALERQRLQDETEEADDARSTQTATTIDGGTQHLVRSTMVEVLRFLSSSAHQQSEKDEAAQ